MSPGPDDQAGVGTLGYVFTGLPASPVITGAQVAETAFLTQLLAHGSFARLELFVAGPRDGQEVLRQQLGRAASTAGDRLTLAGYPQLPAAVASGRLDVVHLPYTFCSQIAYLRERFAPRPFPITGTVHALGHLDARTMIGRNLLFPSHVLDIAVCPSRAIRRTLRRLARAAAAELPGRPEFAARRLRTARIPLGIDTARFARLGDDDRAAARRAAGLDPAAVLVLYVGRLQPWTKMDLLPLLVAVRQVIRAVPDVPLELLLVGQEQAEGYGELLLTVAAELGLGERIQVWSGVGPTDVPSVYALADIFVSPCDNVQESFGLTPIEAMASHLAVVLPAWNGYRDLIEDQRSGRLVPVYRAPPAPAIADAAFHLGYRAVLHHLAQTTAIDLGALTACLIELVRSPGLRRALGEQAYERAVTQFDSRVVVAAHEALWRRAIAHAAERASRWRPRPRPPVYAMDYARCFRHYPSHTLTPATHLVVPPDVSAATPWTVLERLGRMAHLDLSLARTLAHAAAIAADPTLGCSIASLTAGRDPEEALRVLVFLLKHGRLAIAADPGTQSP